MARFRKKPVVIEAMKWDGNFDAIYKWANPSGDVASAPVTCDVNGAPDERLWIDTLEGYMRANPGDWIIRGVKGECYPCKPDIFAATYEPE